MTESAPASILDGLSLEVVEWLPSGPDGGLVRVRGRWGVGVRPLEGLPLLCVSVGGGEPSRFDSLPDARSGDANVWRGAWVVPESLVRSRSLWLEWASGERSALPAVAGLDERVAVAARVVEEEPAPGGEVIDRAVLAERRARRAEAAEQAQARVASEALRALDAVERRGSELEERVSALVEERDALAGRVSELEARVPRDEHARAALSDALSAAAAARRQARDLQLRMRTSEVARTSDAVRLRVLESQEPASASLRAERMAQEAELRDARARAVALEGELAAARGRAVELEAEAGRARSQAVAAAADLDEVRRDFARRAEALAGLEAEVASRDEALGAARAALLEREAELGAARAELDAVRARASELAAAGVAAGAEAETARSEAASASSSLRAERVARASLEAELERERAARSALSDALDAETAALASLHTELNAERAAGGELRAELEAERAAGVTAAAEQVGALQDELARERAARQADQSALAALRDDLEALRAEGGARRDELAALRADLDAERTAREAEKAELAGLRARLAEAESEGGLLDRVAELDRRAAGLADELELQRRAREQAEAAAAAARAPEEESTRVVADLDAAASALRERATNGTTEVAEPEAAAPQAAIEEVAEPEAASPEVAEPEVAAPDEAAPEAAEAEVVAPDEDADLAPAAAAPEKRAIVSARSGPSRALATGRSQREYPWLRGALVKLAHDDPAAAGRLIAGLLPVQAAIVQGPVDYDLTIQEVGTFAVTVAAGRAYVKGVERPRGRREAEFHLSADALTLAELIAGVPHRIGRWRGAARVSGRKRRMKPLRAIPGTTLSLAEAARAGARLEPALVFRTFPYVIHAAWSRGHHFVVAQQVAGDPPGTWYVDVGNGQGIRVSDSEPDSGADATVSMTAEGYGYLLRGEPAPRGHRPIVRGDREAVATLKAWIDRAQGA